MGKNLMDGFPLGQRVKIARTRLAVPASPYATLYQELWAKYGNREANVIGYSNTSPHLPSSTKAQSCVLQFDDGEIFAWEAHLLDKA